MFTLGYMIASRQNALKMNPDSFYRHLVVSKLMPYYVAYHFESEGR